MKQKLRIIDKLKKILEIVGNWINRVITTIRKKFSKKNVFIPEEVMRRYEPLYLEIEHMSSEDQYNELNEKITKFKMSVDLQKSKIKYHKFNISEIEHDIWELNTKNKKRMRCVIEWEDDVKAGNEDTFSSEEIREIKKDIARDKLKIRIDQIMLSYGVIDPDVVDVVYPDVIILD